MGFLVLAAAELAVPLWTERSRGTTWHPHHIAERYELFTIIVLGESVLAATRAIHATFTESGASFDLVALGAGALVLLFGLWWVYFLKPPAPFWSYGASCLSYGGMGTMRSSRRWPRLVPVSRWPPRR